ncbi:MAG: hypothetical protein HKO89_00660 [Saprospiraceae bacterium]|nr:hypothetical protein [Saprospiraceae bacterium]
MNDDRFDDIIRSKLENYKSTRRADWELFKSRKIQSDSRYDDSFDNKLKDRLINYEVQQSPAAWQDLYSRYKQQVYLRNQVIAIKSGELLILFLSLFTFFNFYEIDFFTDNIDQQIAEIEIHHELFNESEILNQTKDRSIVSIPETNSNSRAAKSYNTISDEIKDGYLKTTSGESNIKLQEEISSSQVNSTSIYTNEPETGKTGVLSSHDNNEITKRSLAQLAQIQTLGILSPEGDENDDGLEMSHQVIAPLNTTSRYEDWLSISTTINNNTINSPRDEIYQLDEQVLYTPGYSLSAFYSKSIGPWEHQVGVSYSRISYAPYPVKESYQTEEGINVVSLNNIRYHMMSVPVQSQFHFIRNEDWSLFSSLGLQFGLVLHEYYDISDELDVPLPVYRTQGSETEFRSRLSQKEFTKAVFNGGRFSENIFMHAKFGMGVQRHLGENMHLFLSAEYLHHVLSPLGPNRDKINIFSFGAGLKFRI